MSPPVPGTSIPDIAITLNFADDGTAILDDNNAKAITFMRDLGFPVRPVHRHSRKPEGSVTFVAIEGFPLDDHDQEPLFEALKAHFVTDKPVVTGYQAVNRATVEQ
ncbi:hypothetical protein Slin15195_G076960 [Septoria linicola]|uniref:Uncharacterized protein n=1 Tax=Septoria linicola TaxID=215465 RepID=A0A9Q9ELG8_9PEZI|nr:hypothetical protein Slin14017_G038130 [Septoria linicola]USW54377.1 hypothetical protein Slin15195_G076960 [Septoria linicola]